MERFANIYARAAARKGGEEELDALLPPPGDDALLSSLPDSVLLGRMAMQVFASGFVWRVVQNKWPGFVEAFRGFEPMPVALMTEADLDALRQDTRIIRHATKIAAVRANARMMVEVADEHGSFAEFLAEWPSSDLVGLLEWLKKNGSRLGGNTGGYFLRGVGKDAFLFTEDVNNALIRAGVVDKAPAGKGARKKVQAAFNRWREESGLSYTQMSKVLAYSVPGKYG